jgi:hypothetical protein
MKTNTTIDSSTTKEVPLDADVDKLLNGSGIKFAPVGLGGEQLDTPCIEKGHFELKTYNYQLNRLCHIQP